MPSAQVEIMGSSRRAVTNDAGVYIVRGVPVGSATVRVQRLGYQPSSRAVTVSANDEVVADFVLRPAATLLTTVVAVGYGTANRGTVSTAIASVDSTSFINAPVAGIDNALQGKVPG
ncbi:MAG: carboxypeptidase regulatory-like domain-containing protein, partial [Gemmatimonadaceae bacterium]